jgi:hypothetical protein
MNLVISYGPLLVYLEDGLLAIHSIGHSTVTRDRMSKVLDVEGSLEARCKESTEWSD